MNARLTWNRFCLVMTLWAIASEFDPNDETATKARMQAVLDEHNEDLNIIDPNLAMWVERAITEHDEPWFESVCSVGDVTLGIIGEYAAVFPN